jgi:hypothetical protein
MNIKDAMPELIGAIANARVANDNGPMMLSELAKALNAIGIETCEGDNYHCRTDFLVRAAYDYFIHKGEVQTAQNIKDIYVTQDKTPVVR